jgi:arylsulfatase A-like enzyme
MIRSRLMLSLIPGISKMYQERSAPGRAFLLGIIILTLGSGCDSRDFQKARSLNTEQAFQAYLEKHPRGKHSEESQMRLQGLRYELPRNTNVVLIIIDTLRIDHLGCFGYHRDTSPNLDQLVERSVLFDQAVSQSPWTRPSIASLLTSVYPCQHGIMKEEKDMLAPEFTTLAEFLKAHGFQTAGFTPNPNINSAFGFAQGFDYYQDSQKVWANLEINGKVVTYSDTMQNAAQVNQSVISWLNKDAHEPFYLQVLYLDPHVPYLPPHPFDRMFTGGIREKDLYDGEIRFTDYCLGQLVEYIEEKYPRTLLVLTSDHGEGLRDNIDSKLNREHGHFLYDTEIRALLLFHSSLLPAAGRVPQMVQMIDALPTILDMLGLEWGDNPLQGKSLKSLVVHPDLAVPEQKFAYSETDFRKSSKRSVRTREWKYVYNIDSEDYIRDRYNNEDMEDYKPLMEELFSLDFFSIEKPREDNLILERSSLAEKLRKELEAWQESLEHIPHSSPATPPLAPETARQLEALGYIAGSSPLAEKESE